MCCRRYFSTRTRTAPCSRTSTSHPSTGSPIQATWWRSSSTPSGEPAEVAFAEEPAEVAAAAEAEEMGAVEEAMEMEGPEEPRPAAGAAAAVLPPRVGQRRTDTGMAGGGPQQGDGGLQAPGSANKAQEAEGNRKRTCRRRSGPLIDV